MSTGTILQIESQRPALRKVRQAAEVINAGKVIVYPTDSGYALACLTDAKKAIERIYQARALSAEHLCSIACADIKMLTDFVQIDHATFRLMKQNLPGAYTFILKPTKHFKIANRKRTEVGVRIPNHEVALMLLHEVGVPVLTTTLRLPELNNESIYDLSDCIEQVCKHVDLVIDSGACPHSQTTVIDNISEFGESVMVRQGAGAVEVI